MSHFVKSETVPVGQFLNRVAALRVPTFQRNYAWTEDEVKQLWSDLIEALDGDQPEYFLGPMVLKQCAGYLEIIDGQQRLATICVLLSAIRRIIHDNGDSPRADWFNNEYFGKRDILSWEIQAKFQMNEVNDPIFQKHVIQDSTETGIRQAMKGLLKKDANYLLLHAALIMAELLQMRQQDFAGKTYDLATLLSIHDYLRDHVHVLYLTVTDEADAFAIFETLNDRGRGLTTMDLLKNHVFDKAGGYLEQVKVQWAVIRDILSDIDPRERFLHHYWTSMHGRTSKPQLFRKMRADINNPKSAAGFVRDLGSASKLYAAFSMPGHTYWDDYDQRTRDNLETLNLLDAQVALPILLIAAQKFDETEFGKLTDILVTMAVRYNLIGEQRTGVLNNLYVDIPKKIRIGEIKKSGAVARTIRPIYPTDDVFRAAFSTKVMRDARKARYILMEIEKHEAGGSRQIVGDTKKVNLDHILPRNPSQDWNDAVKSIGQDELREYMDRLGNLALVSTVSNKAVGSKGFQEKKRIYAKESDIKFTASVAQYATWLRSDIDDRQMRLADVALKVWRWNS